MPVWLDGDPARLAQMVGNLLNNACKFTDQGRTRSALAVEAADGQAMRAQCATAASASIPAQLPRLFELFMQADTSLERSTSGLGIGLTLVRSLAEMHGGSVEARSEGLGKGSEFVVRPAGAGRGRPEPAQPRCRKRGLPPTARRVLVVDDNQDAARSLAMLLGLGGHLTRTAYDGLEAIEQAEAFRPDLVLMDIGLPKLNGYEAARRIRQQAWSDGHGHARPDRLGPGRGPPKIAGCRPRRPSGQAGGSGRPA